MTNPLKLAVDLTERGLIPDAVIRKGIRKLCKQRLSSLPVLDAETNAEWETTFVNAMNAAPIALVPEKANEQHYEVPADFFNLVLGHRRKYSATLWQPGVVDLDKAEDDGLHETCKHADLADGHDILELGCGWGSLTLWMAEHYPNSRITGVSNSASQREFILNEAQQRGLTNIIIITADMNDFAIEQQFDRVVSVEMFEHMRNYAELYKRIAEWLNPQGKFFKHIFVHKNSPYEFIDEDESDWMSRHFFSGGIMPSDGLPLRFQKDLHLVDKWRWNGQHYEKTANAWLKNMDDKQSSVWPVIEQTYGKDQAMRWWVRWRIFFMACAELFGYDNGNEWWVSHYLFEKNV